MEVSTPRPAVPTPGRPAGSSQVTPQATPRVTPHGAPPTAPRVAPQVTPSATPQAGGAKCPKCGGVLDMKTRKCHWCVNPITPDSTIKKKTLQRPSIPVMVLGMIGVVCIAWGVLLPPEMMELPGTIGGPATSVETTNPASIVLFVIGIFFVAAAAIKYYRDTQ